MGSLMRTLFPGVDCFSPKPWAWARKGSPVLCPTWGLGASPESRYGLTLTHYMTPGKLFNVLTNSLKMKLLILKMEPVTPNPWECCEG